MVRIGLRVLLWATIGLAAVAGVGYNGSDVRDRLRQTIKDLGQYGGLPEDLHVLSRLRKATRASLKEPELCVAKVFEKPKSIRLLVQWIEELPTPDAVSISCAQARWSAVVPIDPLYRKENELAAKHHVLFRFVKAYEPDSRSWLELKRALNEGQCEVALLRKGEVVSSALKLAYCTEDGGEKRKW